jgi:hypothetical protein
VRSGLHPKRRRPAHARPRAAHARPRAAPSRRIRRLIVVAMIMALLATGAWLDPDFASFRKPATAAAGFSGRPTVAVVGDSITALSRQSIATSLGQAGYEPSIEAVVGIEMDQAVPLVDQLAQEKPNDWIIELGTNDAGRDNPLWAWPLLAEWQDVRSSGCVIYLSVSAHAGPIAAQINASLAGLARSHANVHILDWGNLEYGNPAWIEPDMIHPTPAGQAELASLETQMLRRYC